MEIPGRERVIPKGFELGETLRKPNGSLTMGFHLKLKNDRFTASGLGR